MYNPLTGRDDPYYYGSMNNLNLYGQQRTQQVVQVDGYNGASTFKMGPDSSALLLDQSGDKIWFVKTDGAGYKSVIQPYAISPILNNNNNNNTYDFSQYEERLSKLEKIMEGLTNVTIDTSTATTEPASTSAAVAKKPVTIIS